MPEYAFELETAAPTRDRPDPAGGPDSAAERRLRGRRLWRLRRSPHRGKLAHSGLPKLVAHVLENRGVGTAAEAQAFLGGRPTSFGDPTLLPGFAAALRLLRGALREGRLVSVYGDFDVDGISSTAILTRSLRDLGGRVLPYIPNREREGYGLNTRAIDSLADRGVEVLVTCDCGTSSLAEVEHARSLGLDVVVVDHHLPPPHLPEATALINPKLPQARYPFQEYATGGVAYRLAECLYESMRRLFPSQRYLPLAALATVADMVPLLGENRELVRRGLAALAATESPGLRALMAAAGIEPAAVGSEAVAFSLAPRINAAGRLADARLALDLLLTEDKDEASSLAASLDALNRERQRLTLAAQARAQELLEKQPDAPLLLVGDAAFHQGIIGLVASRLVEFYGRPAVVYQRGESESRGSCRSIPEYDITAGLRSCAALFQRYGGHRQAAGFTIENGRLEELHERLLEHASRALQGVPLEPSLEIDAEWPLNALRSQEIVWLGKLQPHGSGNPDVMLLSRGVRVTDARPVGEGGRHLRLKLRQGNAGWPAIAFDWGEEAPRPGALLDVVFGLARDRLGPRDSEGAAALQLTVLDMAPSA